MSSRRRAENDEEATSKGALVAKASHWLPRFLSLFLRYVDIWLASPLSSFSSFLLLPLALGVLIGLAIFEDAPVGKDRMLLGLICAFWLGMNQTVREIVREKAILIREHFAGVGTASYLISKLGFFCFLGLAQAGVLLVPLVSLRPSGVDLTCPPLMLWGGLWVANAIGCCVGLLFSSLCLFVRHKGEVVAVLLVILITLPQILFSNKVLLGGLVESPANTPEAYWSFVLMREGSRRVAEMCSYFTFTRYLYLPFEAKVTGIAALPRIFIFNGVVLAATALVSIILTWLAIEVFMAVQRRP